MTGGQGVGLPTAVGGAILVQGATAAGSLTVTDMTITGNTALVGGAIAIGRAGADARHTTVASNESTGATGSHGGGIYQVGGVLSITNSTISGNLARDTPTRLRDRRRRWHLRGRRGVAYDPERHDGEQPCVDG